MESSAEPSFMFQFPSLRIIPFEYFNGTENMVLDLLYAEQVEKSQIPVLRFYGWKPYCLSLGRHQDLDNVNIDSVLKDRIDIVRRPTGGSAILHAEELTYSFIIPKTKMTHHEMYEIFHVLLAKVLIEMGYKVDLSRSQKEKLYLNQDNSTFACFNRAAKSEIRYTGKKVVGSAQRIYKTSILQHGSIIIGREHEKIINYLKTGDSDKYDQRDLLRNNSTHLGEITKNKSVKTEIASKLTDAFSREYNIPIFYKYPTNYEKKEAEKFKKQIIVSNHMPG